MEYFLSVSQWNLLESFFTESISPFSFYKERTFGNNLSRYLNVGSEKINALILSSEDMGGECTIVIDDEILSREDIVPMRKNAKAFTYNKTIYYKKGAVRFRFSSEEMRMTLMAESEILFEEKCAEKYSDSFFVAEVKNRDVKTLYSQEELSFDKERFVRFDEWYDKIKGAVIGYGRGLATSMGKQEEELSLRITELKNLFTGLNTKIMISGMAVERVGKYEKKILDCKEEFVKIKKEETILFDTLLHNFEEIVRFSKMRAVRLSESKSERARIQQKKDVLDEEIRKIWDEKYDIDRELLSIKKEEKEICKRKGLKRFYYKKGTPEGDRKNELNELKKGYGDKEKEIVREIKRLDLTLGGITEYDNTMGALFVRISDIMNDIQKSANKNSESREEINLEPIVIGENGIEVKKGKESEAENRYFNILLGHILQNPHGGLSEERMMNMIEITAKVYKQEPISSTADGGVILNCLRSFWKYKRQMSFEFEIPDGLPMLQSIMSFFVKPLGFDQIERYMLNKRYTGKEYAFMLWGASVGFASIPKTFTNELYKKKSSAILDELLCGVVRKYQ